MNKIRFIITLLIGIVLVLIGVTGCGMKDNIFPSQNNHIGSYDYNPYLNKIWVVKDWDGGAHNYYLSFIITKIENDTIEGQFSSGSVANYCVYSQRELGNFSGTIKGGIAEFILTQDDNYSDEGGYKGKVTLIFKEKNTIEADVEYSVRLNELNFKNGKYLYKPYNLKDIIDIDSSKTNSTSVKLDYLEETRIVTTVIDHVDSVDNKIYPVVYLTNENKDILCDFSEVLEANMKIVDVVVEDINKDGLMDIKIISHAYDYQEGTALPDIQDTEFVFLKMESGLFYFSE